jgi:hypothetical protein
MVCVVLKVKRTDPTAETVAKRIIELAKGGEHIPIGCVMGH